MESWSPVDAAFSTLGFDPTGVRSTTLGMGGDPTGVRSNPATGTGFSGDPTGVRSWTYGFSGTDPLMDIGLPALEREVTPANPWTQQQSGSPAASLGGDWAGVDQWNTQIGTAAGATGVPANLLKAVMKLESGGQNLGRNGAGAIGPMQVVDKYWGNLGYDLYDPAQNIMAGATVLKQYHDQYAGWAAANGIDPWKAAVYAYYSGSPYNLSARDNPAEGGSGMSTGDYGAQIWSQYQVLNSVGGGMGGAMSPQPINGLWGGTTSGQSIVDVAKQYLGSSYVWGGIPGKGDPGGNWDCSGMTYWLDQNYGSGNLPMGSHYQYQYAQSTGQLFANTGQLQPGDLVFFDTGNQKGAGAELNRAGHVAMYIGNGQMIHAANPDQGTIISSISDPYYNSRFLGAMHNTYSGAVGAIGGLSAGSTPQPTGDWNSIINYFLTTPGAHW